MGLNHLQEYLEKECSSACKPVDLLQVGKGFLTRRHGPRGSSHLRLVIDGECCLDRLYGGFYSDWVCGGQWNRMLDFVTTFLRACDSANVELLVFFNGALEEDRIEDWAREQYEIRNHARLVMRHISNKATPPPKVWWIPPQCLRLALRYALRKCGIPIACSIQDHHLEVISQCRENGYHGLMAYNSTYAVFDPPHYFDSKNFKLTFKGALETKEFIMDEVAKIMDLNPNRFAVMAALLGNHILKEADLKEFHQSIIPQGLRAQDAWPKVTIVAVLNFVRKLQSVDDLDTVANEVFKSGKNRAQKIEKFKNSVRYCFSGTHEGFLKHKPMFSPSSVQKTPPGNYLKSSQKSSQSVAAKKDTSEQKKALHDESKEQPADKDTLGDNAYTEGASGYASQASDSENGKSNSGAVQAMVTGIAEKLRIDDKEDESKKTATVSVAGSKNTTTSAATSGALPGSYPVNKNSNSDSGILHTKRDQSSGPPQVTPEVMRIATARHMKGLMHPWVFQVLAKGQVRITLGVEEDPSMTLPYIVEFFKPLRQRVYAVLFDLNKKRLVAKSDPSQLQEGALDIQIGEWSLDRNTENHGVPILEAVPAEPLDWKVPSLHRLWLGQNLEDKNCRLRAFLSCMHSDTPMLLDTSCVPQHLLVFTCVLRYMIKTHPIFRPNELDAFLATAVSPLLVDVEMTQDLKLPMITSRGTQLAALFMSGVENAIFANDACGAPVQWSLCCPWMFFDGKLFHFKLLKTLNNSSLLDICDGQMDQMIKLEQLRSAILENIPPDMRFAPHRIGGMVGGSGGGGGFFHQNAPMNIRPGGERMMPNNIPSLMSMNLRGRGRGLLGQYGRGPVDQRGGQLEIAGVVVGNWGANAENRHQSQRSQGAMGRGTHVAPPHVTSVGPRRGGGNGRVIGSIANRGRGYVRNGGRQSMPRAQPQGNRYYQPERDRQRNNYYSRRFADDQKSSLDQRTKEKTGRGRGCTVESDEGNIPVSHLLTTGDMAMPGSVLGAAGMAANQPVGQFSTAPPDQANSPMLPSSAVSMMDPTSMHNMVVTSSMHSMQAPMATPTMPMGTGATMHMPPPPHSSLPDPMHHIQSSMANMAEYTNGDLSAVMAVAVGMAAPPHSHQINGGLAHHS